jgi:hypothetical protein
MFCISDECGFQNIFLCGHNNSSECKGKERIGKGKDKPKHEVKAEKNK